MGRVAQTKPHKTRNGAGALTRVWILLIAVGLFCVYTAMPVASQSGRRQESGKTPKPKPIDPNRPGDGSALPRGSKPAGDEIDPDDVVKISSNLVPIPVSVVDRRGNAI